MRKRLYLKEEWQINVPLLFSKAQFISFVNINKSIHLIIHGVIFKVCLLQLYLRKFHHLYCSTHCYINWSGLTIILLRNNSYNPLPRYVYAKVTAASWKETVNEYEPIQHDAIWPILLEFIIQPGVEISRKRRKIARDPKNKKTLQRFSKKKSNNQKLYKKDNDKEIPVSRLHKINSVVFFLKSSLLKTLCISNSLLFKSRLPQDSVCLYYFRSSVGWNNREGQAWSKET